MVEAIGTIAGSSLEQTTWLRRNLEVKASPQILVDGSNLEADVEGELSANVYRTSKHGRQVAYGNCPLLWRGNSIQFIYIL